MTTETKVPKIYTTQIKEYIKQLEQNDTLSFDYIGDSFIWMQPTKKQYNETAKKIDALGAKGKGWKIYCWYDVSSFEYWHDQQEEENYIQITLRFKREKFNANEVPAIQEALTKIIDECYDITKEATDFETVL